MLQLLKSNETVPYIKTTKLTLLFSRPVVPDSLRPHGLQQARPLCPSRRLPEFDRFMSIASVMPSNHLILWCLLLLLPSVLPSIRDFSNESAVCIRWPIYWSFNFSTSPSYDWLISLKTDWLVWSPCGVFSSTIVQRHQFFGAPPSLQFCSHSRRWPLGRW